jgi:transposase
METLMGVRNARRLGHVEAALQGRITSVQGAERTGLSLRQFKRLKAKVRRQGPAGLLHGNRGRPASNQIADRIRARIEALLTHPEVRLNDHHIRDLLSEEQIQTSADTVRRLRRRLGLPAKQRRRPAQHRRRREREAQRGAMVLIDGSPFRWLGEAQPMLTLVGTIDDASGEILSLTLRPEEDLHGFTVVLRDLILVHGMPAVLYGDRTSIAVRNDAGWTVADEFAGRQLPPHFGQMLEELGIRYIAAHSPEAKGRIERHWQTVQDRLPAELALRSIRTLEAFDAFLPQFLARCRAWFARAPRDSAPAWRPAPRHLDRILACRYWRVVGRDNVVSIPGHTLQIPPGPHRRSYARARVEVRELLDGRLIALHEGRVLLEQPAPSRPFTLVPRESASAQRRPRRQTGLRKSLRIDDRPEPRPASPVPVGDRALLARNHRRPSPHNPWKRRPYKPQRQPNQAAGG